MQCRKNRRAAAAVELSLLLPVLLFFLVISMDYARVFYYSQTLMSCARGGAIYGSQLTSNSPYNSIEQAALAEGADINPPPNVTYSTGTDSAGNSYVRVTVSWDFQTIAQLPTVPNVVHLSRTCQMRVMK